MKIQSLSVVEPNIQWVNDCKFCGFDFAHKIYFNSLKDIVYRPKYGTKTKKGE